MVDRLPAGCSCFQAELPCLRRLNPAFRLHGMGMTRQQRHSRQGRHHNKRKQHMCEGQRAAATPSVAADTSNAPSTSGTMQMELQGKSYHIIDLEGCEYLIATDEGGRLDLRDAYVHDLETDMFARPAVSGDLPDTPQRYAEVPWAAVFRGDTLASKQPWRKVERVYLVPQGKPTERVDYWLQLDEVYVLDAGAKDIARPDVLWNEAITAEDDHTQLVLRIRKDGLYIDRREDMPTVEEQVVAAEAEAAEAEREAIRQKAAASMSTVVGVKDGAGGPFEGDAMSDEGELQDPIDAMSTHDFDGPDDTPAVDLGF